MHGISPPLWKKGDVFVYRKRSIKSIAYHILPQLLHLCVLPILPLANPSIPTEIALLTALIGEMLVLPQKGHFGPQLLLSSLAMAAETAACLSFITSSRRSK